MRASLRILGVCVGLVCIPSLIYAQGAITGVVKDTSGAVLPGVTVEAASPALIEKVRAGSDRRLGPVPHHRLAARARIRSRSR